jgi:glucosylceramidase
MKSRKTGLLSLILLSACLSGLLSCQPKISSSPAGSSLSSLSSSAVKKTYSAEAYLTDSEVNFERQTDPLSGKVSEAETNRCTIDPLTSGQEIDGVGAAMTHSSAYSLMTLPTEERTKAFQSLFSPEEGHFSLVRIPFGTSDYTYTSSFYTFDDNAGVKDYSLSAFSLGQDQDYLIPALKEALSVNPDLTFFAAPWSAPAWMKESGSLLSGRLIANSDGTNSKEEIAYAAYLVKAVEAYQEAGIPITYLSLENEPIDFGGSIRYPNMSLPADQWKRVAKSVGYQLKTKGIKTSLLAYDHNIGTPSEDSFFESFAKEIQADSTLSSYVGAFGLHCYSGGWVDEETSFIAKEKALFPDKKIFITEITEHSGSGTDFGNRLVWSEKNVIFGPLQAGASGAMYWNLCLTSEGKPVLGNDAVCYGILSADDGVTSASPAYYALRQVSFFLPEGNTGKPTQLSIEKEGSSSLSVLSYLLPDQSVVALVLNGAEETLPFSYLLSDASYSFTLRSHSVLAVKFTPEA